MTGVVLQSETMFPKPPVFESEISPPHKPSVYAEGISPRRGQIYAAMFGHGVPREMFPPGIFEDEIMKAVKSCVQNQKDEWMKILDAEE